MNPRILNGYVQKFIRENLNADPAEIALSGMEIGGVSARELAVQIQSAFKAKSKIPEWFHCPGIYFSERVPLEQSSSGITAEFKSKLIGGEVLADLTGGFGIDTYAFSKKFKKVLYVEKDEELCEIAKNNFRVLGAVNIEVIHATAEEFLQNNNTPLSSVYIDPSRRDVHGKKVYFLKDCEPDIQLILPLIKQRASEILIKLSPLFDITEGIRQLDPAVVSIVSVDNDCKELLFYLNNNRSNTVIEALEIGKNPYKFVTKPNIDRSHNIEYIEVNQGKYLYVPGASIMKAGAFNAIGEEYKVNKVAPNTHLYMSENPVWEFPGRIFKVEKQVRKKSDLSSELLENGVNIIARNYPLKPAKIAKKMGVKEGGEVFLIAFRNLKNKPVMYLCNRQVKENSEVI